MELTEKDKKELFERLKKDTIAFSKRRYRMPCKIEEQKRALEFINEVEEKGLDCIPNGGYKFLQAYYFSKDNIK